MCKKVMSTNFVVFGSTRAGIDLKFIVTLADALFISLPTVVIVISFYPSSCLGQETAKGYFSLRVKLRRVYYTLWRFYTVPFNS